MRSIPAKSHAFRQFWLYIQTELLRFCCGSGLLLVTCKALNVHAAIHNLLHHDPPPIPLPSISPLSSNEVNLPLDTLTPTLAPSAMSSPNCDPLPHQPPVLLPMDPQFQQALTAFFQVMMTESKPLRLRLLLPSCNNTNMSPGGSQSRWPFGTHLFPGWWLGRQISSQQLSVHNVVADLCSFSQHTQHWPTTCYMSWFWFYERVSRG